MREDVLSFGPDAGLIAILTRPDVHPEDHDLAVVIPNAGIIHRTGPNRIHVRLARAFAARGVPTLRLDLPGLGDSVSTGSEWGISDESVAALGAALDRLCELGVARRFVTLGLCSGANYAFHAACVDPRVVGLTMIDPPTIFPTRKHRVLRGLARSARIASWRHLVLGRYGIGRRIAATLDAILARQSRARTTAGGAVADGIDPMVRAHEKATQAFSLLIDRDIRVRLVFTDQRRDEYSYRDQLFDTFPDIDLRAVASVELLDGADHTFGREAARARLEAQLVSWLDQVRTLNQAHRRPEPVLSTA